MPLIPREFFSSVRNASRLKKLVIPIGIFFIVMIAAAAMYFYSPSENSVLGENKTPNAPTLSGAWLMKYFLTEDENAPHVGGPDGDPDNDIITNVQEYYYGTNPTKEDTDDDGDIDSYEIAFGQNPNGGGDLVLADTARDYIKEYIETSGELADFSEEKILAEVKETFNPDQPVILDFPSDKEFIVIKQNDVPAFEKYYDATSGLDSLQDWEKEDLQARLFEGMSWDEVDSYVERLDAAEKILKQTPVPSEIINIHKIKIANLRAGKRMLELVRDNYKLEQDNDRFWPDFFAQLIAGQQTEALELAAWQELGLRLKDIGGL
ncbi:MAG: hypothetical protein A2751_05920 [Candidatus Doudnabacteria bacterium RIFCSPHIGHO2_01_FULL_46_14]|uniref:Uncharacterized protein n=1 Tax=Candidatus Doudnabacteria bacterium RIFCSPHIGHO2_01_FULL_46_14 TaxID=1817824 RepID=A0A1F5NN76_9BACT|nr:MAG: hypothetical protein A2751_05920 [Candidatus Doudnabacteria bacterium RIFCSPHIGHO2_01_FULL_46_14]